MEFMSHAEIVVSNIKKILCQSKIVMLVGYENGQITQSPPSCADLETLHDPGNFGLANLPEVYGLDSEDRKAVFGSPYGDTGVYRSIGNNPSLLGVYIIADGKAAKENKIGLEQYASDLPNIAEKLEEYLSDLNVSTLEQMFDIQFHLAELGIIN